MVTVHENVSKTVDKILRKQTAQSETRVIKPSGEVRKEPSFNKITIGDHKNSQEKAKILVESMPDSDTVKETVNPTKILSYGVNRGRIDQAIKATHAAVALVNDMESADLVVTTKNYHRRGTHALKVAEKLEKLGKPVQFIEQPDADHHFSRMEDRLEFLNAMEAFLKKYNPA